MDQRLAILLLGVVTAFLWVVELLRLISDDFRTAYNRVFGRLTQTRAHCIQTHYSLHVVQHVEEVRAVSKEEAHWHWLFRGYATCSAQS